MHDRAIGARARDRVEARVAEMLAAPAHREKLRRGAELVDAAPWRLGGEPCQEPRHRDAVAQVGGARTGELGRVLARLGKRAGILAAHDLGAGEPGLYPLRCGGAIDEDARARGAEARQRVAERRRRLDPDLVAEQRGDLAVELQPLDEPVDRAIGMEDRVRERQRRVRHVGAADIEEPGDRGGIGEDRRGMAVAGDPPGDLRALVGGAAAGEALGMGDDGRHGRGRAARPDRVEGIVLERDQRGTRARRPLAEPGEPLRGVQARVEADPAVARGVGREPGGGGRFGEVQRLEGLAIDLGADLQGVAPVDEDRGAAGKHDRQPGRAGEAGEPGQPFRAWGDILALVLVAARADEAGEAATQQLRSERHEARRIAEARAMRKWHVCGNPGAIAPEGRLHRLGQGGGHQAEPGIRVLALWGREATLGQPAQPLEVEQGSCL